MADSQVLVEPYFVRFHTVAADGVTQKAYPMLVVHEGPSDSGEDQKWGWIFCDDEDQTAGLSHGVNYRADIGRGGPGSNVSWSAFEDGGETA